jgi:hypothetical protein
VKHCGIAMETLADYHEGRADASSAEQIRVHLDQNCAHCLQNLAWLQQAKETLREAHAVQVPERALTRAHAIFRERFRPAVVPNSGLSWLASLQFDSRRNSPALAGARGAKHDGIQLVYTTNVHDIELFQEPAEQGNWYVIGQVMPRESTATIIPQEIILTERNGSRLTFRPNAEEFHMPSVPRGLYEIVLRLGMGDITMPDVGVGL